MTIPTPSSEPISSPTTEKLETPLDVVHTNERVPGHPNYYEKDGLRTYGDEEDHDHEPPVATNSMPDALQC